MNETVTETSEEVNEVIISWSAIWVTAAVSLAQTVVFYFFFLYQRSKDAKKNKLSLYEPRQFRKGHRSPEPFAGSWWKAAWNVEQEELLRCVGLDSFMFLRFLRMGARVATLGTVISIILIPVYATGDNSGKSTLEFNQWTLAKVEQGSNRLWATIIAWFIFVAFILRELWFEWELFSINRANFLAKGDVDSPPDFRYAVRVEQLPKELQTDHALSQYFDNIFPGKVREATVYLEISELQKLCDERQAAIEMIENAEAFINAKPQKPRPQTKVKDSGFCGSKSDTVEYYTFEIKRLNSEIDAMREKILLDHKAREQHVEQIEEQVKSEETSNVGLPSSTGVVLFTSLRAKQSAIQCELSGHADAVTVVACSDPEGILWNNVNVGLNRQRVLGMWAAVFWTVGILFWAVPVAFVASIANLNSLLEPIGLDSVDPSAAWYGLVSGLLPVIFLAILMAVLYMAIEAAGTHWIKYKSSPEVDAYTLRWHQLYQFANLWLILIGGSLFNQLETILEDVKVSEFVQVIAKAIPGASIFFANMIIVGGLGNFGMELSMLPTYGVTLLMNIIQPEALRTQRALDDAETPPSIKWGQLIPRIVFIFLVMVMYCPIVPIMEIFAMVYFGGTYIVWKHQCLHVYAQPSEGGGVTTWQTLFGFLMGAMYMAEVVFIAYMGLKEAPIQAGLGFVPLIFTILVHMTIRRNLMKPLENLSLEIAAKIDNEDGEISINVEDKASINNIDSQVYAQPALKTVDEERVPLPYRRQSKEGELDA